MLSVFLNGAGTQVLNFVINWALSINVIDNKFSRIDAGVHEVDDSAGPLELTVKLHSVITVAAHIHDWTDSAITTMGGLDVKEARGTRWVDLVDFSKGFE
ncbi:hypothetical protein Q1J52_22655 [Pseudomonas lijiangensis]|uniref:hypothetical protein n=1 Tax=Pseudomonas lijiangensis TaxID=2995658 RepID=UPI0034D977B4